MTKNEKLKQIREAVDIALEAQGLESTRALKFGCKIRMDKEYIYGIHPVVNKDFLQYPHTIIGRDINWEDCSLAIKDTDIAMDCSGGFLKYKYEDDWEVKEFAQVWKPKVPLHLQDPSTIDFVYELIINNK